MTFSPRTPSTCRGLWSPAASTLRETPLVSWAELAEAQTRQCLSPSPRKASGAQALRTPQPRAAWSYIASPSIDEDGPLGSPDLGGAVSGSAQAAGDDLDWHLPSQPMEALFPFGPGPGFPWQGPAHDPAASPGSPGAECGSPFQLHSRLPSPPPFGLGTSPGDCSPVKRRQQELLAGDDDPDLGRFRRDFGEIEALARGEFSTVYRAKHKTDGQTYAVKVSSVPSSRRAPPREVLALATTATAAVASPHLIRYFSAWREDEKMHIQLELCATTLRQELVSRASAPEPRLGCDALAGVLRQAASGLAALHGMGLAHLDVKPENILGDGQGLWKVGDLGLATPLAGTAPVPEGDCRYLAWEVLQGSFVDLAKADSFSLALVCYEAATNPRPLPQNGEDWQALREGRMAAGELQYLPGELAEALLRAARRAPGERPSCGELAEGKVGSTQLTSELEALRQELEKARQAAESSRALAEEYRSQLVQFGIASSGG